MSKPKIINLTKSLPKHPTRKYKTRNLSNIKGIVVHCTDNDWTVEELVQRDITSGKNNPVSSKGCPECTYHGFVDKDGTIYQTVDYNKVSWHAAGYNSKTVGVVIRYMATGNENPPPTVQLNSLYKLLAELALSFHIKPDSLHLRGHRELQGTGFIIKQGHKRLKKTCPGMLVSLDHMRLQTSKLMQKRLKKSGYYNGAIDGLFGPKSLKALAKW